MSRNPAPPGGVRIRADILTRWPAQAMQALLDRDPAGIREGDPLPLGWHWLYFKRPIRASNRAPDGHERRGAFMPDVGLPRRMWAGGKLRSLRPALVGRRAELRSEVRDVREKVGKSGRLVFVEVVHALLQDGRTCVEENRVIVYREAERRMAPRIGRGKTGAVGAGGGSGARGGHGRARAASPPFWTERFVPTRVALFQFSALTYNAHRIHYDHTYATGTEGYRDLLVHAPLTALLLLDAAGRRGPDGGGGSRGGRSLGVPTSFEYRALAPLYADEEIVLAGRSGSGGGEGAGAGERAERVAVEALGPGGIVAMRGAVEFGP